MRTIKSSTSINAEKLKESSNILRALAHPLRMQILQFIDSNKAINVNKIYNTLKLEQSITSQHLRVLRTAGIVITDRNGKYIHYTIDYAKVAIAVKAIGNFLVKPSES
jgi:DNA-binding transcriptional ArsR family regulator